jgi:subtilisin family serine protease
MKLQAALFAAALMAAGAATAHAAAPENETKSWIVGTRPGAEPARSIRSRPVHRFQSVEAYVVQMTEQEAAELRRSGDVRYVEPDYERHLYRARTVAGPRVDAPVSAQAIPAGQTTPWGIERVAAKALWSHARGRTIRVGVVDTGVDHTHADLRTIPSGRHRRVSRPLGFDFVNGDNNPIDDHGHGTHVAGTIGAIDNDFGVVGVSPEVELFSLKVLRPDENGQATGSVSNIIKAIDWAIENGLHILNLSLGSDESSITEKAAVQRAWDAGVLIVAASGNGYPETLGIGYPAAYPNVIAVGAISEDNAIASFSQRGTGLTVVAPGVNVFSTSPVGRSQAADVAVNGTPLAEAEALTGSPFGEFTGPFVNCGTGNLSEIPASVAGRIALIQRGGKSATNPDGFTFNEKVRNAKAAGAAAVVIYNHENSPLSWTLIRSDATGKPIAEEFPLTIAISKTEGEALLRNPGAILHLQSVPFDYWTLQGTSMATPHVTGVAALIWSLAPEATAAEVRNAIIAGARDLGEPGWDPVFGHGAVDALRSAQILAPERLTASP